MSNLTSIVTKYVKYTNKKIEDFESKIEELEKRLQNKQDIRHSVKFVMD
jgi:cell division septum initiation protein DivIVA